MRISRRSSSVMQERSRRKKINSNNNSFSINSRSTSISSIEDALQKDIEAHVYKIQEVSR